jgi:hypothetical protein
MIAGVVLVAVVASLVSGLGLGLTFRYGNPLVRPARLCLLAGGVLIVAATVAALLRGAGFF